MAADRERIAREPVRQGKKLYGTPPKAKAKLKMKESDDELELPEGGLGNSTTAMNKAKAPKNLQIEVYNQNAKLQEQVMELFSDDDDDDNEEPDFQPKGYRKVIKEEPVESYPCKRPKTSKSRTAMDQEKEADDDLQTQVHDQIEKTRNSIQSLFDFEDEQTQISMKMLETRDLSKGAANLTDNIFSSNNELQLYGKDQSQPFHESISSDNEAPLAIIHQDTTQIFCEFGSSSESKPLDVKGECSRNSETSQFDIVSSDNGAIKISLLCNCSRKAISNMPDMKAITEEVEDKYRNFYGITDPDFSVMKLMEEICRRFSATAAMPAKTVINTCQNSSRMQQPSNANDSAMTPNAFDIDCRISQTVHLDVPSHVHGCNDDNVGNEASRSRRLKAVNHLLDITRGEESVKIPLLNDNGSMELPDFFYISKNIAFKDAYVNFSLARISDDNCCSQCVGDCLSSELPCACAGETRGEFAYTPEGLLKQRFLNEAITMSWNPKKQHFYYCKNCPLVNNPLEKHKRKRSCEGHLMRKFIKECWNKCGCSKKCGNRVVQRGITATLQVFSTPEGKGWGLRSVHALKKGTFVCEYVGEIVTNHELHLRNKLRTGKEEHTYPVLLDADWGSERVLKDEEALCLDATKYGNCGRFINHRCVDANLVEIPVEMETPDHHYYHLAFFTTRDIEPMEELSWDYGIQFDDKNHPIKAFNCKCGSKFCRDQENS